MYHGLAMVQHTRWPLIDLMKDHVFKFVQRVSATRARKPRRMLSTRGLACGFGCHYERLCLFLRNTPTPKGATKCTNLAGDTWSAHAYMNNANLYIGTTPRICLQWVIDVRTSAWFSVQYRSVAVLVGALVAVVYTIPAAFKKNCIQVRVLWRMRSSML